MIKEKIKQYYKSILITTAVTLASLVFCCMPSNAADYPRWGGDENGGMPSSLATPPTGLFPQLLSERVFRGEPDTQYPYEEWSTNISTGVVYCANQGTILRFGKKDPNKYYPDLPGTYDGTFIPLQLTQLMRKAQKEMDERNWQFVSWGSHTVEGLPCGGAAIDRSQPIWYSPNLADMGYVVKEEMKQVMGMLAGIERPPALSGNGWENYNHPGSIIDYDGNSAEFGPTICVMESGNGRGYAKTDSGTAVNDQMAYILTAMEDVYNTSTPHKKYNEQDIQSAYWMLVDSNVDTSHCTGNGFVLKQKAEEYEKFLSEISGGYNATLDNSNAQVIVNQKTGNYIVGPFSTTYPEYQDISYVKALAITTDTGKTLIYDESHNDLEILCETGSSLNNNGQTKTYPSSGEYFYIKFSAEKAGYPKNINLSLNYEYLGEARINYNDLEARANIYQYFGYVNNGGEHAVPTEVGYGTIEYTYKSYDKVATIPVACGSCGGSGTINKKPCSSCGGSGTSYKDIYEWRQHTGSTTVETYEKPYSLFVRQPYIQMDCDKPVQSLTGQPLTAALEGERKYKVHEISVPVDLSFELGGKVWVDGTAGKENSYDGIFNSTTDTPMPNVKVSLYKVNELNGDLEGEFVAATTTDANGQYLFKNQNSMFEYYVKFTYNGQYYQPTIYNAKRDDPNWKNNSKGLDILSQRDEFNAKFEEIGSAPENTVGCPTAVEIHTRKELQDAGLIDEFGNIPGALDEKGERKSTDNYVNYSMMDSYTCNGTSTKDLYPACEIFVIDTYLNNTTNTQEVLSFIGATNIEILYGNPDIVHHINQGYVLRELVDLALRKDVYETTLEINGKTQTYKYNKREGLETDENGNSYWEIQTRVSDGYYDYNYSRELFREDYDYKIDNYVMDGANTSLDNLGLTPDSELKIFVTYKFTIRNRSEAIAAKVTEVVDYYDEDYTFVPERSFLGKNDGTKIGEIKGSDNSKYGKGTETQIAGYKNLYITGENGGELPLSDPDDPSKDVYFYLTFIVNKDADRNNILDEDVITGNPNGVGKENIAEINGYKSYYGQKAHSPNENNEQTQPEYKTGDIAGIPDRNSTPGNLDSKDVPKDGKINYENFENDTDKAPNIRIILNRENLRTVEGNIWEDIRNVEEQLAKVGNGLRENEIGVNGVRVQLVELRDGKDGNKYEYIWKEVYSGNTDSITPIINNSGIIPDYTIDTNNANGKYKFASFVPGNYIVRFIYGSSEDSVLGTTSVNYNTGAEQSNPVTDLYAANGYNKRPGDNGYSANAESIGLNKNSYNGHDYKSTSYQVGIDNGAGAYENNSTASYSYNFTEADKGLYSDAKDIMNKKSDNVINLAPNAKYLQNCSNSRKEVEAYSNGDEKNSKAEILSSFENLPEYLYSKYGIDDMKNILNQFMNNTYMISESGTIDVNFEYNRTGKEENVTNTSQSGNSNIGKDNYDMAGYYVLKDLDLGLEKRPEAQLKVTKQITNVKVTLADNRVLFDASDKATNVLWIDHIAHGQDTKNTYSTKENYEENIMKNPIVRQSSTNKGKVQLTMDEELMHGSTIQITYAITVANVGEVDYQENQFYYTGKVGNKDTIVKTNPRLLVDYVGTQVHDYTSQDDNSATRNNLQFSAEQNPAWKVISSDDLLKDGLVNTKLTENVKKYTEGHIVTTDAVSKDLIPIIADQSNVKDKIKEAFKKDPLHALDIVNASQSASGVQLILSQMITQDSSSDDRIYNNMTELVTTHNDVGRRMSYSVVGNQDPTIEPREIDADDAQEVIILPPFGQKYIYYVLGTIVATILIAGITITLVVLKKKK